VESQPVRAKFAQHRAIRGVLLGNGTATIIEHTTNDRFRGDGGDGTGENWLGRILMEVREEIR
jgi:N-glycosidase YbiA